MSPGDGKEARRRMLLEMLAELDGGAPRPSILFSAAVDQYLADLATRSHSAVTARANRRMLDRVVREMGDRPLSEISTLELHRWRAARLAEGIAHSTLNTRTATLSGVFRVAQRFGQLEENPVKELERMPALDCNRVRVARALTDWECSRLLAAASELDFEKGGIPQELVLRALLLTGARWGELVRAKWCDVDLAGAMLTFPAKSTKNGRARHVPLEPGLLRDLLAARRSDRLVSTRNGKPHARGVTVMGRWIRDCCERSGVARVDAKGEVLHVHALRHTFATRLIRAGVPVQHVQYMLGHADPKMTIRIYTHFRAEDMRKAIEGLPRLGVAGNVKKAEDGA